MTTQEYLSDFRARLIAREVDAIKTEREFLATGAGRNIRTLRLMAFRTIRSAQKTITEIAAEIEAEQSHA